MNDTQRFTLFRKNLLRWFAENRRPLPWRADYTPYRTWIAEVMMQQTQMDRGVRYFLRWMERFPDVAAVAAAPEEDLLKAWEGLGYYRRARNVQAAARVIMERHGGVFPRAHADILALPGVGPYTAGAIASTAYNEEVPCVDGNVERVLSRVFDIDAPVREEPAKSRIRELAQALIPKGEARNFNQGLMELGALVCRKKPECDRCPLAELCESRRLGIQNERPVPGKKAAVTQLEVVCGVLLHEGKVFIQRRRDKDVWGGLWEFPGGCVEPGETPERAVVREWQEETGFRVAVVRPLDTIRHNYTTYRITLRCYLLELEGKPQGCPVPEELTEATACQWIAPQDVEAFPLPAPHRKLADNCSLFDNPASGE
uniref:A/G-specific adenine glycosylase n=1 Tax=uncultured Bilophila sp. TaxID=529385 RepID=UPI0025F79208|nr:A/G-specific adenine glycosylase [uncultured Bilophila sp.]